MKKIMIIASIAMIACVAHAANFVWGFGSGEYYDQNSDELYTGTAFLYLGTVTASATAFDTSAATLITYGGFDEDQWSYGNMDATNLSSSDLLTDTTAGQPYTLILLNKNGVTSLDAFEGYYALETLSSTEESIPGATVTTYANMADMSTAVSTGSYMSVPEPTSGLLLLLGMAGLALKRKIA